MKILDPRALRALAAVALALCASIAIAAAAPSTPTSPTTPSNPADKVRARVHEVFPQLKIVDVRQSAQLPGWYELFTGSQLVYSDATGDHLLVGKIIDTHTHKDLAAEELANRLTIDFPKLPFDSAIKIVKGDGSRRLALFEDPDCPFCQQFEHEMVNLNNVTLYVFLFPITELHPDARNHALAIWCAKDRASAWTHWMLEHKFPGDPECKDDPIDKLQALGNDLNVTGTPTFFLTNGKRVEGVLSVAKLEELLTSPETKDAAASEPKQVHSGS
jgi:thiol:disulfide interchange protein DsbC